MWQQLAGMNTPSRTTPLWFTPVPLSLPHSFPVTCLGPVGLRPFPQDIVLSRLHLDLC